jgi:hypothetical protein
MNFVNLTPHKIVVVGDTPMEIEPSGTIARVSESRRDAGVCAGIPVTRVTRGTPEGIPEQVFGTVYIVSGMVLDSCAGRGDIVAPDTGAGAVRDDAGRIVGTRGFIAAPQG